MNNVDAQYLSHMDHILLNGVQMEDRTGTGTRSIFGHQMRFDLRYGFPLLTTKKVHLKSIIHELIWFLKGDTNIKYLNDNGVSIWDGWANEDGDLGPIYGEQWRSWKVDNGQYIDQLGDVINTLNTNPDCRRMIVTAWNPGVLPVSGATPQENASTGLQALPPCHCVFQFNTEPIPLRDRLSLARETVAPNLKTSEKVSWTDPKGSDKVIAAFLDGIGVPSRYLSCQLYQRSADWFLGVPFNIASYALLTHMVAQVTGMVAKDFIHTFGDTHLYLNHLDQAKLQLERVPYVDLPTLNLNKSVKDINGFSFEDVEVLGYHSEGAIRAKVSI